MRERSLQSLLAPLAVLIAASACAPAHQLAPYSEEPELAARLERSAQESCIALRTAEGLPGLSPPVPFTTDGCSAWPDNGWVGCCLAHDVLYWCGGSSDRRRQADQHFRECVAADHGEGWARSMYWGVRVGGSAWWPTPWRWGYGWPLFHGYEEAEDQPEHAAD